ncbi:MAG: hypothetical protein WD926_01775 [Patescibacteria group bacterium]
MEGMGNPRYPVRDGRPVRSAEELRTDEHSIGADVPHAIMLRDGFVDDAVEVLDPAIVDDHPTVDRAVEALGLRCDYGENTTETVARCLRERQAELEAAGFAAITKDRISDRTLENIDGLGAEDRELLTSYVVCGCPDLSDKDELAGWVDSVKPEEIEAHRLGLRRSARRLAVALGY